MIFDCDGVLVDSEELAWDAWRIVLQESGLTVDQQDVDALTGLTQTALYRALSHRHQLPPEAETLAAVARTTANLFERGLRRFQDATRAVHELGDSDVPLAVASSSPRWRLDLSLEIAELGDAFSATVAGDEVHDGKPAPDLYLAAAAALGVEPQRCVAVEDTATGLRSARAAGMRVVGVARTPSSFGALESADRVVSQVTAETVVAVLTALGWRPSA